MDIPSEEEYYLCDVQRKAKYYSIGKRGRQQLDCETKNGEGIVGPIERRLSLEVKSRDDPSFARLGSETARIFPRSQNRLRVRCRDPGTSGITHRALCSARHDRGRGRPSGPAPVRKR